MPTIPTYTKCIELGCKEQRTKSSSFCEIHGGSPKPMSEHRWRNQKEYDTPFWQSTRRGQLSRQPLCASCLLRGVVTQANHVDHLFPWTAIGGEAFRRNVYQSLCQPCHSRKTSLEQRGVIEWYKDKLYTLSIADYAYVLASH